MTSQYIADILDKLGALRDLFVMGQRAVPFLEEIFSFLEEISPLLDEINVSMRDTTSKMPKATSQLQSVSQATELATNEILDLIDAVLLKSGKEKERVNAVVGRLDRLAGADEGVIALLRESNLTPGLLAELETFHAQKAEAYAQISAELRTQVSSIDEVRDKINRIMLSLQVQDITTQQIADVNHLIESIRRRLNVLVERLGETKYQELADLVPHPGTFDANARYEWSGRRQAGADVLVTAYQQTEPELSSQNDIDALFAGDGQSAPSTPASSDDIDALFGAAPAPASNDDIDALFGAAPAPASTPASMDDIDALFGAASTPASNDDIDALFGAPATPASQDDIDKLFG